MTTSQVTAASSLDALAAAADAAARAALHTLNVPDGKGAPNGLKARPKFPTPPRPRQPSPGTQVTVFAPGLS